MKGLSIGMGSFLAMVAITHGSAYFVLQGQWLGETPFKIFACYLVAAICIGYGASPETSSGKKAGEV